MPLARVLLVGDDNGFRQLVMRQVTRINWSFALIDDVAEALTELASRKVSLVAIAEGVPTKELQQIQDAAQAKSIPTMLINPLDQAQVKVLIDKLKTR